MTRKGLKLSFLVLGIVSVIAQVVIQRELISGFYGNEFFVGVVLASWLLWVAFGSLIAGKISRRIVTPIIFSGVLLFLTVFAIRILKSYIGLPGEIPNLIAGIVVATALPSVLCLTLGMWWTSSSTVLTENFSPEEGSGEINRAYLLEIIGFVLGGVLFGFVLIKFQEFLVAIVVIALELGLSVLLLVKFRARLVAALALLIAMILPFTGYLAKLNQSTSSFRYKGQELLESKNSLYGNVAVTRIGSQYNFYENGVPFGSTEKVQFAEELAHLSLLEHPSPKKILLIGGGGMGVVDEILKHPVERLYYFEIDPELMDMMQRYIPSGFGPIFTDNRVVMKHLDARYFLRNSLEKFDVVIVNLPAPSTALINRYYTQEFFEIVKQRLNAGGIFVNCLPYSSSSPSRNLILLDSTVLKALRNIFSDTLLLPEDGMLLISSADGPLAYDSGKITKRFDERKIQTDFISKKYLIYRFTTDRVQKALDLFGSISDVRPNKDLSPISYFYHNLFWLDHFYPKVSLLLANFAKRPWVGLFGGLILLAAVVAVKRRSLLSIAPFFSMLVAGFSLMALEMVVIFSYQVIIGYLYYRIALLISAMMLGMGLGVFYGNTRVKRDGAGFSTLKNAHLFIIVFCLVLPLVLMALLSGVGIVAAEVVLFLCAITAGFLGARIFPFSNEVYLSSQTDVCRKTGVIYGADLLGSALGAMLLSLILIPLFGVFRSLLFIVGMNLLIVPVLFLAKYLSGKSV